MFTYLHQILNTNTTDEFDGLKTSVSEPCPVWSDVLLIWLHQQVEPSDVNMTGVLKWSG